jgi:hypothetical protein
MIEFSNSLGLDLKVDLGLMPFFSPVFANFLASFPIT